VRNQGYSNQNQEPENQSASGVNNRNLLLGNPSNAVPSVASIDNYLMVKPQYVLSYNNKTNTANWVSWQLNGSWIGAAVSLDNFRPDDALPAAWYKVRPNDYTGSGYDRVHIAPSADRTRNEADNSATFLMSNMMPQVPELNRGVWGDLEEYCRELVERRAKNFTSPAGPVGRKSSIDSSRKSQCWQRIGKLSWCWIDKDWECRQLTQIPGRSP